MMKAVDVITSKQGMTTSKLVALQQEVRLDQVLLFAATVCTLVRLPGVQVGGEVHVLLRLAPGAQCPS